LSWRLEFTNDRAECCETLFCCQDTNNHPPEFTNTTYAVTIPETTPPGCISDAPAVVMHDIAYCVYFGASSSRQCFDGVGWATRRASGL